MGSKISETQSLRKKLKEYKEYCLICRGRRIDEVLVCEDRKCDFWKKHQKFIKTIFPGCCSKREKHGKV